MICIISNHEAAYSPHAYDTICPQQETQFAFCHLQSLLNLLCSYHTAHIDSFMETPPKEHNMASYQKQKLKKKKKKEPQLC